MIISGVCVNIWAWVYWGNPNLARRYCGVMWMGSFDAWNKEKIAKFRQVRLAENQKKTPPHILPQIENFFVRQITGAGTGNLRQYIWGGLYKSFGVMASQPKDWGRFLVMFLPLLCFFGYMGPARNMIFFIPGIMVVNLSLHVHSNLLVSGGRRERFWAGMILAAAISLLVTAMVTFMASLSLPLELFMPDLTIKGHKFVFNALNINLFFVPLVLIPVTFTIGLIFHKKPLLTMIFTMVIFMFSITSGIFSVRDNQLIQISPMLIVTMLLCSWILFVLTLRYICVKRCLGVWQRG